LPVGSSARITGGSDTSARAIATAVARRPTGATGDGCPLGEPDLGQQGARTHLELGARQAHRCECSLDVLERRQRRDQIEVLEDEAEGVEAQLCKLVVGELPEIAPFEEDIAVVRAVECSEQLEECRLAGAAWPLERDELPRLDRQVEARQPFSR
jgi:hypothetical protein